MSIQMAKLLWTYSTPFGTERVKDHISQAYYFSYSVYFRIVTSKH